MGLILNPRGAGGAGKTALVRRLMAAYGPATPLHRPGRTRPAGYCLPHPAGGRPLIVLGAYEASRGGCDTIPLRDGGLAEALQLAGHLAATGHDVILEGRALSREQDATAALAAAHLLHVLALATPPEACARALAARHRAPRAALPHLTDGAAREQAEIAAACARLWQAGAVVESLLPEAAFLRARALLKLDDPPALRSIPGAA
ncbi:hypothetical protein [Roseicella aquatilis]|uniref:Uncharacterized protein n=1 Tax=Roseicella aquatilis TaxID=2527868 RepID=A0A4V2WLT6_9PROT|nr:hypothetical protein [Roseicella aquatilis]TCZ63527.1 hypothetical protein EXY23_09020 [Roseicella aquatilis]